TGATSLGENRSYFRNLNRLGVQRHFIFHSSGEDAASIRIHVSLPVRGKTAGPSDQPKKAQTREDQPDSELRAVSGISVSEDSPHPGEEWCDTDDERRIQQL